MFKHILVPVDGSELSSAAVTQACAFAREIGARLTFYYARPAYYPTALAGEVLFDDVAAYESFRAAMVKQADSILNRAAQVANDADVACEMLSDDFEAAYEGIISAAENKACDLVFMASHGRRGASALLLGSETQKVLTHCKIPVLVYR